jgi:hypothetical protein
MRRVLRSWLALVPWAGHSDALALAPWAGHSDAAATLPDQEGQHAPAHLTPAQVPVRAAGRAQIGSSGLSTRRRSSADSSGSLQWGCVCGWGTLAQLS